MLKDDDIEKQLLELEGDVASGKQANTTVSVSEPVTEEEDVESQLAAIEANIPDSQPVDEVAITDVAEIDETPEEYYLRTGEAPAGYKYVPSVPTGDRPEDRVKLERIDVPTSAAKQTDEIFGYEKTAEAYELATSDIDLMNFDAPLKS